MGLPTYSSIRHLQIFVIPTDLPAGRSLWMLCLRVAIALIAIPFFFIFFFIFIPFGDDIEMC